MTAVSARRRAAAALLTTLLAATACTGPRAVVRRSAASSSPSLSPSAVTPSTSAPQAVSFPSPASDGIVLAVDGYAPDSAQTAYLMWSAEVVTADCVRGLGFDVPQPRMPTAVEIGPTHDRRYGVVSPNDAASFGYHLAVEVEPPTSDPYATVPATALDGGPSTIDGNPVPVGGCRGQTSRTFGESVLVSGTELTSGIDTNSYANSLDDPGLQVVFGEWSACMGRRGLQYTSPVQAADRADLSTAAASPTEIATAVADVACKTETDLVARWSAIESTLEAGLIAADLARLQAYRTAVAAALLTCERLTSVRPPP